MKIDVLTGTARKGLALLKNDLAIYLLIAAYIALAMLAASWVGAADRLSVLVYPQTTINITLGIAGGAFVFYSSYVLLIMKPDFPLRLVLKNIRLLISSERFFRAMILLAVFTLFFSAVSSIKTLIPAFQPFAWDHAFMELDKTLHGGIAPWQLLQPVLGWAPATFVINLFYNLWFLAMFSVFFWQLFATGNEARRQRFFFCFIFCWAINGSLLASLFSSAGPCFIERLYPEWGNPYGDLMAYLQGVNERFPVWAISTQDMLWDLYSKDELGIGAGISAMPSMHVSVVWLIFLLCREYGVWPARLAGAFVFLILIGSVHLGWHYAVDGYLSFITTTLIWWAVGCWQGRRSRLGEFAGSNKKAA